MRRKEQRVMKRRFSLPHDEGEKSMMLAAGNSIVLEISFVDW